jgi:sulfite reductase (NADPH) flavoprotein alpha-component
MTFVPVIPENAPFTAEQRAYLNGFLAGLFSHSPVGPAASPAPVPLSAASARPLEPLAILFGSQTGNSERLAKRLAKQVAKQGFAPTLYELANYTPTQLAAEGRALLITSTYGDGEPPDNAKTFWETLKGAAPSLQNLRFSLCALGDSNYPRFCGFGIELDARLAELGATRVFPRIDCDVDYEEPFVRWMTGALAALGTAAPAGGASPAAAASTLLSEPLDRDESYSKERPFPARLKTNCRLNGLGSTKDVRHLELVLAGSGLAYEVGDALGVMPRNCPALVDELLSVLGLTGDEAVPTPKGGPTTLRDALSLHYEITRIPKALLETCAAISTDESLRRAAAPQANGALAQFLRGREVIDLLLAHPHLKLGAGDFVRCLRPLQPRLYSISSSPKAHPDEVHLTVGTLRYESLGRARTGVCSTFLAERVDAATPVPVFVHPNKNFRPPAPNAPLIMVGPGTGIAPFRAFLQERRQTGAPGRNWLFFGDQKASTDFLYREELEQFQNDGLLTRLDLAWSREQADKVYVQHRMRAQAGELFAWLEEGAGFYVCGDASRMAKDVETALHEVVQEAGGKTPEQAADYVRNLQAQKRYLRDVY